MCKHSDSDIRKNKTLDQQSRISIAKDARLEVVVLVQQLDDRGNAAVSGVEVLEADGVQPAETPADNANWESTAAL